jgi:DNA-directed RNA polymerase specialized sigma24 family protein
MLLCRAEDLSQDVLLEIIRSIGHYKKDSSLNTWIYRITVNKSLDHLRKWHVTRGKQGVLTHSLY